MGEMIGRHSHGPSLLNLGYRIAPVGPAVAVVASAGDYPLYPWEIITQHKALRPAMRAWCIEHFGLTVERHDKRTITLFYRLHTANARTMPRGFRVDMVDHWNRVHSFVARGQGERSIAYTGREKFIPSGIELANTEPCELTRVKRADAETAGDAFTSLARQLGMRRILTPRAE